ncbi:MAG: putative Phosphoribosyltransferase [Nitrospira sp.]|nr:putative Phosphoribosyltransferase [Nitrospira sp.]
MANPLGLLLSRALPAHLDADLLMPVPLHPNRLRRREFNQSLLLADRVGAVLCRPVSFRNLIRLLDTDPQTTLPRSARLHNLRKAFALRSPAEIKGKSILLIDDVFTTGATVNECARILRESGAQDVQVLALARSLEAGMVTDVSLPQPAFRRSELRV